VNTYQQQHEEEEVTPETKELEAAQERVSKKEKDTMEAIRASMDSLAETYAGSIHSLDKVFDKIKRTPIDDEAQFIDAVQGSKGSGQQKSNRLITLRQLRKQRAGSLRDLSEEIGVPFPHVSEIERGMRLMTPTERDIIEEWAGGRIHYRLVPYIELKGESE
jgi:SMC interacting uncharacterized protein involved in chromosome segregation